MGGRPIPWREIIARLREDPGRWILLPVMTARPARTLSRVRLREVRALREGPGRVQAKPGWIGETVDGRRIADVYLRWVPERNTDAGDGEQEDEQEEHRQG